MHINFWKASVKFLLQRRYILYQTHVQKLFLHKNWMVDVFSEVQTQPYLHFLAKGSSWSKKNLTLLICSVCHSWELRGNNHRIEALRIRLHQTVTGLWPGNMQRFICWAIWESDCHTNLSLHATFEICGQLQFFYSSALGCCPCLNWYGPTCYKLMCSVAHLQKDNIVYQHFRKVLANILA